MKYSLDNPKRLQALAQTGLMGSPPREEFDRLARIASCAIGAPISLVSLVDDHRQCFPGAVGLPKSLDSERETPLSHSFCQHVVTSGDVLVVEDARKHDLVKDNLAVSDLGVISYAGVPITMPDGSVIGSFCSISKEERKWSEDDVNVLKDLSTVASELIRSRTRFAAEAAASGEIAEGRRRLKQILDSTGEGIYGIDDRGICTFANRKCVELLGYDDSSELLDMNMHSLIHHTHKDGSPYPIIDCKIFRAVEANARVHEDDEVYWRKDRTSFPVEYRSYPVVDGGPTRAVVTFIDITTRLKEEKQLKEALDSAVRANQQKSRFLANMSHEIRTPMNSILGFGELLEEIVQDKKARGYIRAIRASGNSLLNLINDILDLSKIESGKLELRPEPISVRGMVESVRLLFAQQAAERNLDFTVSLDDACPDYLELDDLRVRQLLLNLISNSLKFTPDGSVSVAVSAEKDPLDAQLITLEMSVADTGIGIPEGEQKAVFQPFRQVDGSDALGGTGLGLSICRHLTKLMGGKISLESEEGRGSTFTILLPNIRVASGGSDASETAEAPVDFNLLKPSRILVVDDNQFNRELAAGYLGDSHHEFAEAADGLEGLEKVRDWKPDVVMMDIRMPVMDGKEARRRIKEDPELKSIPVLAVTASSLLRHTAELRRDFDGYMRKPFSRTQMFRALAKVLPALEDSLIEEVLAKDEDRQTGEEVDRSKWPELVKELQSWDSQYIPQLRGAMVIGDIAEFASELFKVGTDAACEPVASYAELLRDQASGFELSKLEATLGTFGELIEQLEEQIQNTNING